MSKCAFQFQNTKACLDHVLHQALVFSWICPQSEHPQLKQSFRSNKCKRRMAAQRGIIQRQGCGVAVKGSTEVGAGTSIIDDRKARPDRCLGRFLCKMVFALRGSNRWWWCVRCCLSDFVSTSPEISTRQFPCFFALLFFVQTRTFLLCVWRGRGRSKASVFASWYPHLPDVFLGLKFWIQPSCSEMHLRLIVWVLKIQWWWWDFNCLFVFTSALT